MNIKQLRTTMDAALADAGLTQVKLFPKREKVWAMPGAEVILFFEPSPYRRPWGFVYCGILGLEIPTLRAWLIEHRAVERQGIFRGSFTGYHSANDDMLKDFMIELDKPVPSDLWAGLIVDRLAAVPNTISDLVSLYTSDRENLGWFAHPHQKHAWDFLLQWRENPDPDLHVPVMQPDGRIV